MAHWKHKIDVHQYWQQAQRGEITPPQLATVVLEQLHRIAKREPSDCDLEDIISEFEAVDESFTWDDWDDIWERLYDWGDTKLSDGWPPVRLCWVGTQ